MPGLRWEESPEPSDAAVSLSEDSPVLVGWRPRGRASHFHGSPDSPASLAGRRPAVSRLRDWRPPSSPSGGSPTPKRPAGGFSLTGWFRCGVTWLVKRSSREKRLFRCRYPLSSSGVSSACSTPGGVCSLGMAGLVTKGSLASLEQDAG